MIYNGEFWISICFRSELLRRLNIVMISICLKEKKKIVPKTIEKMIDIISKRLPEGLTSPYYIIRWIANQIPKETSSHYIIRYIMKRKYSKNILNKFWEEFINYEIKEGD